MSDPRLYAAVSEEWDWQLHGACRGADGELFFHPPGERGVEKERREEAARSFCRRCPVVEECRTYALDTEQAYGVWGGLTEDERREILRRRTRRAG